MDSLVMIYTPLPEPEPEPESPSSDSPASSALPTTGVDAQIAMLAATIGAAGILSGLALVGVRRVSVRGSLRR
jgi:LPXTG-motif cell wall-anchored protein